MSIPSIQSDPRAVAVAAFLRLFEPLTQFAIDIGLSPIELNSILRHASVKGLAERQRLLVRRVNISGISARTGIPRSEISRILRSGDDRAIVSRQPSMYRVITAWRTKPRFTDVSGSPLDLKIYGKGSTFESLVRAHGAGIPLRATLDEMIRIGAVEMVAPQKVRVIGTSIKRRNFDAHFIEAFGESAAEFISLLLSNAREPGGAQYVGTASGAAAPSNLLPPKRKNFRRKSHRS